MNPLWVLIIVLLVLAVVGVPRWGYQHTYGYYPSGVVIVLVVVLVILLLTGRL